MLIGRVYMNDTYHTLCAVIIPSAIIGIPSIPGVTVPIVKNLGITHTMGTTPGVPA